MSIIKLFLIYSAMAIVPLVTSFQENHRFFEYPIMLVVFYLLSSFFLAVIHKGIVQRWDNNGKSIIALVHIWGFIIVTHFLLRIETISTIHHLRKYLFVFTLILFLMVIWKNNRISKKNIIDSVAILSFMFLAGSLWQVTSYMQLGSGTLSSSKGHYVHENGERTSTFVILLDMFSYEHAYEGKVAKSLEVLAQKYNLTLYHKHYASYSETKDAVPQVLHLSQEYEAKNIFELFKKRGFEVSLLGESLPYCRSYRPYWDFCRVHSWSTPFLHELRNSIILILQEVAPQIIRGIYKTSAKHVIMTNPHSSLSMIGLFKDYFESRAFEDNPIFSYLHLLLPHGPFVLSPQCQKTKTLLEADEFFIFDDEQKSRYKNQALCTLFELDNILDLLKRKNLFDQSKVVIFSDHGRNRFGKSAKNPKNFTSQDIKDVSHVIALTKYPGQKDFQSVRQPTSNNEIQKFILLNNLNVIPSTKGLSFSYLFNGDGRYYNFESIDGEKWTLANED